MPSSKAPWIAIDPPDQLRYQPLVDEFIPAVRLKPFDLWTNFRAHHRAAIMRPKPGEKHISRIRLAVHYIWDAPTIGYLRRSRPGWSPVSVERWHQRFQRHLERWGPGDVELVRLDLLRRPGGADPGSLGPDAFVADEIEYRTGAHFRGVLEQARRGEWDKLGNRRVRYRIAEAPLEMMGRRPVLTVDSYHHSFYEPGEAPPQARHWPAVVPQSSWFTETAWREFQVVEKRRGHEEWEVA